MENINWGQNWPNQSTRLVQVCLTDVHVDPTNPDTGIIDLADLTGLRLVTDGGSDDWNMDALTVDWLTWGSRNVFRAEGTPLFRFSASHPTFDVRPHDEAPGPLFDGASRESPAKP